MRAAIRTRLPAHVPSPQEVRSAASNRLAALRARLPQVLSRVQPHHLLLGAIVVLGAFLRLYQLASVPAGFFCDEASIGYNAYAILTTGRDEFGVAHPMFFQAFGEYKSPIEIYSTVPSIALFGLNEFATRLPSALYGVLGLIAIYLLAGELFKQSAHARAIALVAALLLAISPWDIHFSRVALEGLMPWVLFTTLALYVFLKAQARPWLFPVAVVLFALALYSYFPARIFVPLFGIGLCVISYRFLLAHKRETLLAALVLVVLLFPFVQNLLSPTILARWQQVSIFAHPPTDEPVWQHIVLNYLSHFSPDFLFTQGDIGMPGQFVTRHSVRGMGELYLVQLPLILYGLYVLARQRTREFAILLLWLVLFPVGSMLTTDQSAQATRSIIGVVPWQIVSAVGLVSLLPLLARLGAPVRISYVATVAAIILVSFAGYLSLYFGSYNSYSSDFWGWQYGAKSIVGYFVDHQARYDDLVMAPQFNAPEIFFKFYAPGDCSKCRVGLPDDSYQAGRHQLFAVTPDYIAEHPQFTYTRLDSIRYPDGSVAFVLAEVAQPSS